jgi:hypothetical protein
VGRAGGTGWEEMGRNLGLVKGAERPRPMGRSRPRVVEDRQRLRVSGNDYHALVVFRPCLQSACANEYVAWTISILPYLW